MKSSSNFLSYLASKRLAPEVKPVVLGLLSFFALILGQSPRANADTTPPELVSFSISPLVVDVSGGPATLSVRIEAQDDLSGFGSGSTGNGSIDIRHTSGNPPFGRGSLPITGGTLLNPIFEFTLTVPQFSRQGMYPISITLLDNVFNTARFDSSDLATLGFPSQIEVTSIGDTTPPELLNLSVAPLLIDTSTGAVSLSVMIEARDDLSGFGSGSTGNGSIDIRHSSGGNPFGRGSLPITGGTLLNPIFEFTLTAPQFSPEGIYPISVTLLDNVFNQAHFSSADLAALGFPSQVEIQTPPPVCVPGSEESGDNIIITNESVTGNKLFDATQTITTGPNVTVTSTGCASLFAGDQVEIKAGTKVDPGGVLQVVVE